MPATVVQSKVVRQDSAVNTVAVTFDSNFTPGNAIIALVGWYGNPANTTSTLASITTNKGHGFIRRGAMHRDPPADASWAGDLWVEVHDCLNAADANPSTKITATFTGANSNNSSRAFVTLLEVSGLEAFSRASTYVSGGLGSDTVVTRIPELPSAPQWAVGVLGVLGATVSPVTQPSGWTLISKHDGTTSGDPFVVGVTARVERTTTAQANVTWMNAGAVHGSAAAIATYTMTDSVVVGVVPVLSDAQAIGVTTTTATPSVLLTYTTVDPPPPVDPDSPFTSDSEWTTPIPPSATYHADSRVAALQTRELAIMHQAWTINGYYATSGDPDMTVRVQHLPGVGSYFPPFTITLKWPAGAVPNGWNNGEDGHMFIVQPDNQVWDFWYGRWDAGDSIWTFASAMRYPLGTTRGWRIRYEGRWTGGNRPARAVDVSLLGGLIRPGEITAGVIPHALAMAIPRVMLGRHLPRNYPADPISGNWDGGSESNGPIVYSDRFAIPRNINVNSIARFPAEAIVLKAAQDYGVYVVDVGGPNNSSLYAEYPGAYNEVENAGLRPSGHMSVLLSNLRFVGNWY